MKNIITACATLVFTFAATTTFAKCFDIVGTSPTSIGPVSIYEPATKVCVNKENTLFGRKFWSVEFSDEQGALAQFASNVEMKGRCFPTVCTTYVLTSGNANGANVNPDQTQAEFKLNGSSGTLIIPTHRYSNPQHRWSVKLEYI